MKKNNNISHPVLLTLCQELNFKNLKELSNHCRIAHSTILTWDRLGHIASPDKLVNALPNFNPVFLATSSGQVYRDADTYYPESKDKSIPYSRFEKIMEFLQIDSINAFHYRYGTAMTILRDWLNNGKIKDAHKYTLIRTLPSIRPEFILWGIDPIGSGVHNPQLSIAAEPIAEYEKTPPISKGLEEELNALKLAVATYRNLVENQNKLIEKLQNTITPSEVESDK